MEKYQRPHDENQQIAKSVRPQLPRDGSKDNNSCYQLGTMPKGGFQAVWNFSGNGSTKESGTDKPGGKVY